MYVAKNVSVSIRQRNVVRQAIPRTPSGKKKRQYLKRGHRIVFGWRELCPVVDFTVDYVKGCVTLNDNHSTGGRKHDLQVSYSA